jgi:hypothetical protein
LAQVGPGSVRTDFPLLSAESVSITIRNAILEGANQILIFDHGNGGPATFNDSA